MELVVAAVSRRRNARLVTPRGENGGTGTVWEDRGPEAVDVSGSELTESCGEFVEVGHAERRRTFDETDDGVRLGAVGSWLPQRVDPPSFVWA